MRNVQMSKITETRTPQECDRVAHQRRGVIDFQFGNDFPPEYDTWDRGRQYNYELGRQQAAILQHVDVDIIWPMNKDFGAVLSGAFKKNMDKVPLFNTMFQSNSADFFKEAVDVTPVKEPKEKGVDRKKRRL